jgi:ubiquitin C-terminal hydrolase
LKHVDRLFNLTRFSTIPSIFYLASDTDSGRGSSIRTSTDSPKTDQQDESIENKKRRSLIKGLFNIGNTCFFNVIIQVCT